jgi:ATP-dependent Clp protease ATP-binding subunit ClpA
MSDEKNIELENIIKEKKEILDNVLGEIHKKVIGQEKLIKNLLV